MKALKPGSPVYGVLIILECMIWGIGNPVMKIALFSMPPFWIMALRFTLASVLCFLFLGKDVFSTLNRSNLFHCIVISFTNALCYIFSNLALAYTSATAAGFLMSLSVIFTPFLSYFFIRRIFDLRIIPIVGVVVMGLFILCGAEGGFSFGRGEAFGLATSFCLAVTITYSTVHVADIGYKALSTSQCLMCAAITIVFALLLEDVPVFREVGGDVWLAIVFLAVFCSVIGYVLQNVAFKHVSPVLASLAFSSEPVFTAIAAYFMIGEVLPPIGYFGSLLIFLGIVAASVLQGQKNA